jgi:uncharacterized protein
MNRRTFIKTSVYSVGGLSLLGGAYCWQVEPFWLQFTHLQMPIAHLPASLVGKTLMQISDIHIGNRFDYGFVIRSFETAKTYNPDFVVYTGDYVTLHNREVQFNKLREVLSAAVKGRIATLGILGNHDYGVNWSQPEVAEKIAGLVSENSIHLLRNNSIEIEGLTVTGFDD